MARLHTHLVGSRPARQRFNALADFMDEWIADAIAADARGHHVPGPAARRIVNQAMPEEQRAKVGVAYAEFVAAARQGPRDDRGPDHCPPLAAVSPPPAYAELTLVSSVARQLADMEVMEKLMAGFEQKKAGPRSRSLRSGGKFARAEDLDEVPVGERHAIRDGESVALCGARIVVFNGEWAAKQGPAFRDHPKCVELVRDGA